MGAERRGGTRDSLKKIVGDLGFSLTELEAVIQKLETAAKSDPETKNLLSQLKRGSEKVGEPLALHIARNGGDPKMNIYGTLGDMGAQTASMRATRSDNQAWDSAQKDPDEEFEKAALWGKFDKNMTKFLNNSSRKNMKGARKKIGRPK